MWGLYPELKVDVKFEEVICMFIFRYITLDIMPGKVRGDNRQSLFLIVK